jgi:hypothetical protein
MDTQSEDIKYDYYQIECMNLQNVMNQETNKNSIKSSFKGKINQPNLIHRPDKNTIVNYQATDLFIYGNLHNINNVDGELVIAHSPTTSAIKIYCCFPFAYKKTKKDSDIDAIFSSKSNSVSSTYQDPPITISLNKHIPSYPKVTQYKTTDKFGHQCLVVIFDSIIYINHKTKNLDLHLFQETNNSSSTSSHSTVLEDKLRTPSLITSLPDIEGMDIIGDDEAVYQCEYLPVDSEDMVQVLQVPIGSPGYNNLVGTQVSNVFLNNAIFMFFVVFVFIMTPLAHNFIEGQLQKYHLLWLTPLAFLKNVVSLTLLNLVLILIIFVVSVILLCWGITKSNSTATSIGIFLPFCAYVGYLGITYMNTFKAPVHAVAIVTK